MRSCCENLQFGCDRWPLHYACRTGNLEHVKYLVNVQKVPIDEQDTHDATPLYLAALTGRNDICQLLLESGAKCDPDSGGDAARVFYVALTPELRKLLREWSLSAASRDPFLDMLRRTFNEPTQQADTIFRYGGRGRESGQQESIYLHRILLMTRCPKLADHIVRTENGETIYELRLPATHNDDDSVTKKLLEYLYTGVLETRDVETAMAAQELARAFGLTVLQQRLHGALERYQNSNTDRTEKEGSYKESLDRFRCDMSDMAFVRADMVKLAKRVSTPHHEVENIEGLNDLVEGSDTTVRCDDCTWSLHSFLLCGQSEYFRCALTGGFREAEESFLDLTHLLPSPEAVRLAIQWLYCDQFLLEEEEEEPNIQVAVWLLELGTAILCPRLVSYTTNTVLIPAVDVENVFDMLELSRDHNLDKLEDTCVKVMAANLETVAYQAEFQSLLHREASEIVQSGDVQVTDIPIAAEMKSAISKQEHLSRKERRTRLELLQQLVMETVAL
jgi:hypothetical protein